MLKHALEPSDTEIEKTSILIIDDDEHILNMLTAILFRQGYVTETAKNGAEAIEKSNAKFFNIALIDIVLPDMQGTQLLVKLKDTVPKMRKIIITGHASLDNAVKAVNLGADAYIMKPVKSRELLKVIEEQLTKQREDMTMIHEKVVEILKNIKSYVETKAKQLEQEEKRRESYG